MDTDERNISKASYKKQPGLAQSAELCIIKSSGDLVLYLGYQSSGRKIWTPQKKKGELRLNRKVLFDAKPDE